MAKEQGAGPGPASDNPKNLVHSLAKGFRVLEAFDAMEPQLTLAAVAQPAGLDYATAFGLLNTLVTLGYVDRIAGTRNVRLGVDVRIGSRIPANCSALLDFLLRVEQARMLDLAPRPKLMPRTVTDLREIQACLAKVRKADYAVVDQEITFNHRRTTWRSGTTRASCRQCSARSSRITRSTSPSCGASRRGSPVTRGSWG